MNVNVVYRLSILGLVLLLFVGPSPGDDENADLRTPKIVQYGKMHEVIGQQQHQGRVTFSDVVKQPRFFGVAALKGLQGEATIFDGQVIVTKVGADGKPESIANPASNQAALLVGAYVTSWNDHTLDRDVSADDLDSQIEAVAAVDRLNVQRPFPFVIEGAFTDVRLHVINGACPLRARMRKGVIPEDKQPFESEMPEVVGRVVGVFAKDSVGEITHPATSTHMHLLYRDSATGKMLTGHLEQITVKQGAILRLP